VTRRGFTLIEVLVATAILGIILTTVYGVVARTLQTKNRAEARADLYAAGREAILKMADEVEAALPPVRNTVFFYGVPGEGRVPADAFQFMTVVRRQYSATQMRGGRALVSYSLDPMPNTPNLFALRRQEELITPDLAGDATADPTSGSSMDSAEADVDAETVAQPPIIAAHLLDRVAGLRVRYLDPVTGSWTDAWDTEVETRQGEPLPTLPAAVEMVLFLADEEGGVHDFGTIVDLPLANLQPTPTR